MNIPTKLSAYAVGLAAVFGATAGVGAAVGPIGAPEPAHHSANPASDGREQEVTAPHSPGGLEVSKAGYTLDVADHLPAAPVTAVSFRILGPDARPVTSFDTVHDKEMHLIAVRRDLAGYQHVHPTLDDDGTWTAPLELTAGAWRLFADFDPAGSGAALVLGTDVVVAGDHRPLPLPAPSRTAQVEDFTVTLEGEVTPGRESQLTFTVSRCGLPVTDLQPYLGAYGHLVALRNGDLAYLHVHPAGDPGDGTTKAGPGITFYATAPSAGVYRLFLDFRHGDVVRTAEFTVQTDGTAPSPAATATAPATDDVDHDDDGHGH